MAAPSSRQELVDYCLRALGAPVLEINIDDDQIEDRVDEAIQFYREYHSDAIIKTYRKHQVTADNVSKRYITLPDQLLFVSRIFPLTNNSANSTSMWSARYQLHLNDIFDLKYAGSMVNYSMTRMYLETLDLLLNGTAPVRFNRHMNRLFIDMAWAQDVTIGDWLIVEGFETLDPDTYTDIYNDMFLKKYLTALLKRQWGANLIKFEGMQLPGGVTLNGRQIFDDATAEIAALEETMDSKFSFPPDFMVG
jgi:hypothetical protein